jgi:hypothetical protein
MNARTKNRILDDFRAANCEAVSCAECGTNKICMLYAFFSACDENNRTAIEVAVELLEDHGFHITDIREERARRTDNGHVIDECGIKPTGALLIRAIPVTPASV